MDECPYLASDGTCRGDGEPCIGVEVCGIPGVSVATDPPTQGAKYDGGKLRFDLIPAGSLEDLAKVYTIGARKYAPRNWEKGIAFGRLFGAIMRHLWAWWRGEDNDPETGLPHPAHAAWGCFALLELMRTKPELDDRPVREAA